MCLTRPNSKRWAVKSVTCLLAAWLIVSVIVVSFQCNLPQPWLVAPGRCVNFVCLRRRFCSNLRLITSIVRLLDGKCDTRHHNPIYYRSAPCIPSLRSPSDEQEKTSLNAFIQSKHTVSLSPSTGTHLILPTLPTSYVLPRLLVLKKP